MQWSQLMKWKGGYPFAVVLVTALALALFPFRASVPIPVLMLLFVPLIVFIARVAGTRPSTLAAVIAFLFIDLLFIPPYFRLTVDDVPEWIGLSVFLAVALISGQQTGRLREREQAAVRRQQELELLNRVSFRLGSQSDLEDTAAYVAGQVTDTAAAQRVAIYRPDRDGALECTAAAGGATPANNEPEFAAWVYRTNKAVMLPTADASAAPALVAVNPMQALPGTTADADYLPLQTANGIEGVLVAQPLDRSGFGADEARLLVSIANLTAAAFERERLSLDAATSRALHETDRMKSTFVSSVSHELKTPLAAATARVTGLIDEGASCDSRRVRDELEAVAADLERLDSSIGALLDLSRLESDSWQARPEPQDVSDILGTALTHFSRDEARRITFMLATDLPMVMADFTQLERALVHLMENALTYSPPGSPVEVGARAHRDVVAVWIEDRGPGVSNAEKDHVFEKFYRGGAASAAPSGTGLGLAIAAEVVRSHGGTLRVEDAHPHGARFVMTLPAMEKRDE